MFGVALILGRKWVFVMCMIPSVHVNCARNHAAVYHPHKTTKQGVYRKHHRGWGRPILPWLPNLRSQWALSIKYQVCPAFVCVPILVAWSTALCLGSTPLN